MKPLSQGVQRGVAKVVVAVHRCHQWRGVGNQPVMQAVLVCSVSQPLGLGVGNVRLLVCARRPAVVHAPVTQVLGYVGDEWQVMRGG